MNPKLQNIISKYEELDKLAASGEDVVADLRKEINNLELEYLKETVFPHIANTMGSMVKGLRCQIDGALQLTEDNKIGYSFCTSRSMLMVQDNIAVENCKELSISGTHSPEPVSVASEPIVIPDLRIEDYSEKAIVVRGDTKRISDILDRIGGTFNFRLKGGAGWIFPKYKKEKVEMCLDSYMPVSKSFTLRESGPITPSYSDEDEGRGTISKKLGIKYIEVEGTRISTGNPTWMYVALVNKLGPERVFDLKIPFLGGYLVDININQSYLKACKLLKGGYWLNSHSSTKSKIAQIKYIASKLKANVRIQLDENPKGDIILRSQNTSEESIDCEQTKAVTDIFSAAGIKLSLSEDQWVEKIVNMRSKIYQGLISPHKAIFMLAISALLKKRLIRFERIEPSYILSDTYISLWHKYVPSTWPFKPNVYQPYMHMSGEDFYGLKKIDSVGNFDINLSWSRDLVLKYVEYAFIDEELKDLLKKDSFSNRLEEALIDRFINQKKDKSTDIVIKENNGRYSSFKSFLKARRSSTGRYLSESTIKVYNAAIHSEYVNSLVSQYEPSRNIDNIENLNIIEQIISLAEDDVEMKNSNRAYLIALKLYHEYRINFSENNRGWNYKDYKKRTDEEVSDFKIEGTNGKNDQIPKRKALFSINGSDIHLGKNRTVLQTIKLFLREMPNSTFKEIEYMFPKYIQGSYGVVRSLKDIQNRSIFNKSEFNRWFLNYADTLVSSDKVRFAVCTEWGNQFHLFQKHVKENLGWDITEV